jgi:hypothetical protein
MLLGSAVLYLAAATVGSARSWDIVVDYTAKAGHMTLPAGDYTVKFDKDQAEFIAENSGKKFEVPVKTVTVPRKFENTAVVATENDGKELIESIELGGTTTELEFSK